MLKKIIALLVIATSSASCTIVNHPQQTKQKEEKNYDDIAVYVKDGFYKCEYLVAVDSGRYGINTVDNGRMLLKIGRIDDLSASMSVVLSSGVSYSSKELRLQKPEKNGTQYLENPNLSGSSGRPGMAFTYNYLDDGGVGLSAALVFVKGFQSIVIQTNWCKEIDTSKN
ncbi:hypothetical protein KKJ17_14920 [Xenorhabdus bovienii]|uniref:hypothetical protein n=1 Tax=Xenorhabdus bovienii TaxID=40576 RepID=UPI0023B21DDA|nr:hypothetical protein [Xenorhabdus bovienii]MDE9518985.1 hypothetical protein [Xenorhabdus bovienii]